MTTLLISIHVVACIVLILVVLLQAGRGADMGAAFGGASSPMFGAGSSTNPLARVTTLTAVTFLATALLLAVASARRASVFDDATEPLAATPRAESAAPAAEAQPGSIPATGQPEAAPIASDQAAQENAAEIAPSAVVTAPDAELAPPVAPAAAPVAEPAPVEPTAAAPVAEPAPAAVEPAPTPETAPTPPAQ